MASSKGNSFKFVSLYTRDYYCMRMKTSIFLLLRFIVTLKNFSLITDGRLQSLTYICTALIEQGSLACHTYCDIGHPFIMVISDDP